MRVKTAFVAAALAVVLLARVDAQLFRPDSVGLTMGHVLLNVTDVNAHRAFWTSEFNAKPITVGKLEGVTIPGVVILFRPQPPTGPSEGTTINHMGLKLNKLADFTSLFEKGGWHYDPPRVGREKTVQTYVTGPDKFRMELVEDTSLPVPVVSHHLHYWMEHPLEVKKFYVQKLLLRPTIRGPYESGDIPGMNLTFAPLGSQKVPGVPTKGRLMDEIGFDVSNLRDYVAKLQANGTPLESGYARDPELGLMSVRLTDPWGVNIRLTEGLSKISTVAGFDYTDSYVVSKPID